MLPPLIRAVTCAHAQVGPSQRWPFWPLVPYVTCPHQEKCIFLLLPFPTFFSFFCLNFFEKKGKKGIQRMEKWAKSEQKLTSLSFHPFSSFFVQKMEKVEKGSKRKMHFSWWPVLCKPKSLTVQVGNTDLEWLPAMWWILKKAISDGKMPFLSSSSLNVYELTAICHKYTR